MSQWNNRLICVTGSRRGIGLAIAKRFLELGAHVIGTATTSEGTLELESAIQSDRFWAYPLKLEERDSIASFLQELKKRDLFVDTLINNAGCTDDQLSIQISYERWASMIESNLTGTFFLTQGILRKMLRERFGRIITLSSIVGFTGNPGQVSYCSAKAGLEGMMKSLALEVASRQITVNNIAPGFIATDMTNHLTEEQKEKIMERIPNRCLGTVEDIVYGCEMLADQRAQYITGQTLHINGGMYLP